MKKQDVRIGTTYVMNHSSGRVPVRILCEKPYHTYGHRNGGSKIMTHWTAINLTTGRTIEVKSAAKLLREHTAQ